MRASTAQRIDREIVIDAALRISRRTADAEARPVTGATLGKELSVDRSAVWRHFSDRSDLLSACGDRLLAPVVTAGENAADPWGCIAAVFATTISSFRERPLLAAEVTSLTFYGPNWRRVVELVVTALGDLGLGPEATARFFRVFAELTMSWAAALAASDARPAEEIEREQRSIEVELASVSAAQYPHLAQTAPYLVSIDEMAVSREVLAVFRTALDAARANETDTAEAASTPR